VHAVGTCTLQGLLLQEQEQRLLLYSAGRMFASLLDPCEHNHRHFLSTPRPEFALCSPFGLRQ
jgi:hypothetical protein